MWLSRNFCDTHICPPYATYVQKLLISSSAVFATCKEKNGNTYFGKFLIICMTSSTLKQVYTINQSSNPSDMLLSRFIKIQQNSDFLWRKKAYFRCWMRLPKRRICPENWHFSGSIYPSKMRTLFENIPFLVVLVFPFLFKYPFVFTLFCKRPNQGPLKISESVTWPYLPHISMPNLVLIQLTLVKYGFMGFVSKKRFLWRRQMTTQLSGYFQDRRVFLCGQEKSSQVSLWSKKVFQIHSLYRNVYYFIIFLKFVTILLFY